MAKNKFWIILIIVAIIGAGFLFQSSIMSFYNTFGKALQDFKKSEFSEAVQEIGKEILAPSPLAIGGTENNSVFLASKIIAETNAQRRDNGSFPALVENKKLNQAAQKKAEDMFAKQYFEHVSPSGIGPGDLVTGAGYEYILTGENLILGNFADEKEIVRLWMESPGHRANILHNRYAEIGVAIIKGTYQGKVAWIGVQEFGLPLSVCAQASVDMKNNIEANKNVLDILFEKINDKRAEIQSLKRNSPKYDQLVKEHNALVEEYNSLNKETEKLISDYNVQVNKFNDCVAGK